MMETRARMSIHQKVMQSGLKWLWVGLIIILLDRFSKMWALKHLMLFTPREILPVFNLTLAYNTGAAFSFLHDASGWQHYLLGGLAVLISAAILRWLSQLKASERFLSIGLTLILSGALSNAFDRILYTHVVDFLDFHWQDWHFAIFNVADAAICIGAFMLMWHWMFLAKSD